jgi:hypothetical protein
MIFNGKILPQNASRSALEACADPAGAGVSAASASLRAKGGKGIFASIGSQKLG